MTLSHLVTGAEAESFLVDPPETRWQTLEPEQLSYGHDPGSWRCGGHSGAHTFQRHLLSHLGGSLLVRALKHSECLKYIMRNKERLLQLFSVHFSVVKNKQKTLLVFPCLGVYVPWNRYFLSTWHVMALILSVSGLKGKGQWLWGVHEVEEADQCSEVWTESNPQPSLHTLVVAHHQQSQRQYIQHFANVSFPTLFVFLK